MLETSSATVGRVRERFFMQGLDAALERSMPDRIYERTFGGRAEARLIALACPESPEGRDCWSMRLLAEKAVQMGIVHSVSHETVSKTLKKRTAPPPGEGLGDPTEQSARFVWRMEEVLDLYEESYDRKRPVVCFDERPCQLLAEVREPLGPGAGRPERRDHEYRGGAWPTSSWPSNPLRAGEGLRCASVGVDASSPSSCAILGGSLP